MRLLNFSIGKVKTMQIGTASVKTAHIKAPVAEPWEITMGGAQGDERAVHPDKIYVFSRNAYQYWGAYLGLDPSLWPDGYFGENLTLDEFDDTDVRVGDRFALGEEVELVVSGARTPCIKLAWRLGQPRSFQKTFAKSRQTGGYFDVLRPGNVRPGDKLVRTHHDPAMPSIADVCDYISQTDAPPLESLVRLLDCQYLSPANRLLLSAKVEIAARARDKAGLRWSGWREFEVNRIVNEATNIKSFYLKAVDGGPLCDFRPGQHVTVRLQNNDGQNIDRVWSLSSYRHQPKTFRITVLRQDGAGSSALHSLSAGDRVRLRAPSGDFALDMGSVKPLVLIAAGVGITPLMAMLEAQISKKDPGYVHLIYGGRMGRDMAFRRQIDRLKVKYPSLRATFFHSQSNRSSQAHAGRISFDGVKKALSDMHIILHGRRIDLPWYEGQFYLCGPEEFCRTLIDDLVSNGADPGHVFTENFSVVKAEASDLESARVNFSSSDKEVEWTADSGMTLLQLAETAGLSPEHDCRAGSCLTCRVQVLEGETTADMGDGTALLCIGRPKSSRVSLAI